MLRLASRSALRSARIARATSSFPITDRFVDRHMGPTDTDAQAMLATIGYPSLDALVDATIPADIRLPRAMDLPGPVSEVEALAEMKSMMSKNVLKKSLIGQGYYETTTPGVILRNMLENPGWYTSYTPYQAEISQGRLEMLLSFQTMVADLTGHDIAGASLLDEGTAAAEALNMCIASARKKRSAVWLMDDCHTQTIGVVQTRCAAIGVDVRVGTYDEYMAAVGEGDLAGVLIQYPGTNGAIRPFDDLIASSHDNGTMVVAATDLLALSVLRPPGEMGADISVGSAQRFGVPMGFGGPHAAFIATHDQHKRAMPGRIIGVSVDSRGLPCLRMAMQTREQHIRRDKATSNICTAQALLANMAAAYGCFHGPQGVRAIAQRVNSMAVSLRDALGDRASQGPVFDTFTVTVDSADATMAAAVEAGFNLRRVSDTEVGVSFGEAVSGADVAALGAVFGVEVAEQPASSFPAGLARESEYMTHPVFNTHHSETQMLRYLKHLENKDLSLAHSMISLGSCTMKLNATSEMIPVTWPEVCSLHPFVPEDQSQGYAEMISTLDAAFREITGFAAVSHQPNSGAQGEFAGLMCIREYHRQRGDANRTICLVPVSAHGTNPASAVMAGMKVVTVKSDAEGNIDLADLREKAEKHSENLGALMVTYPSTFGKFETGIREALDIIHSNGGQVYMDGANMNAQVGMCSPGHIGADVCHLNLHKTFCIPHGGGGPGVGTICVAEHLAPFLPGHSVSPVNGNEELAVSAAPFGSAAILPISWMYIRMLGEPGLRRATQLAILNANYMAQRLREGYDILFAGLNGNCAHEFIIDLRGFKADGIVEEDVAKRLQDYGFHSPTMSWPVPGTLMVEPTESEDKAELDRFCDAMLAIRAEIADVVEGRVAAADSPLKHAPHTVDVVTAEDWDRQYSRTTAAWPAPWSKEFKFWPTVGRIDNVHGDRNLICSCPPVESYSS